MIVVNIRGDMKPLQKAFVDFHAKQAPFAMALALTQLAKGVQAEEQRAIKETFDNPTPFTVGGIAIKPATKKAPIATVYPRDIAETYLAPYVVGGDRSLGGKKGMLVPREVALNQYGNLKAGTLAALKAKPGVFIGSVRTKGGKTLNGVWQKTGTAPPRSGSRRRGAAAAQPKAGLKLLIQFEDSTQAPKHFPFYERAQAYLKANTARTFEAAMRRALATRRR